MTRDEQEFMESIDSRLQALESKALAREQTDKELLEMFHSVKGFMTVLVWIERVSIWVAKMSVAAGIMWWLFRESVLQAIKRDAGG